MRAALDEGRWVCDTHEPQWLAPAWQWASLLDELLAWDREHPGGGPHPGTRDLQAQRSRVIPGTTCSGQAAAVQRWHDDAQRNAKVLHAVAFGTRTPAAIERAIDAHATDVGWEQRMSAVLADFPGSDWVPALLLRPLPAEAVP